MDTFALVSPEKCRTSRLPLPARLQGTSGSLRSSPEAKRDGRIGDQSDSQGSYETGAVRSQKCDLEGRAVRRKSRSLGLYLAVWPWISHFDSLISFLSYIKWG